MFGQNLFTTNEPKSSTTAVPTAKLDGARRTPTVMLRETEDAVLIDADLPGVKADQLNIAVDHGVLSIHGAITKSAKAAEPGRTGFRLLHQEYEEVDFVRTLTLPDHVDTGAISASVRNGVVTITLPKVKPAQARRIAVKTG